MAPQKERILSQWVPHSAANIQDYSVSLTSKEGGIPFTFSLEAVRNNVFKTTFTSDTHPTPPHPSVPAPEPNQDLGLVVTATESTKTIANSDFDIKVDWETSSTPIVTVNAKSNQKLLYSDVPNRSYTVDGDGVASYTRYFRDTLHVGLGEKAAPMDLSGRKFDLGATDSFGYDVYKTDPLYKHIPFLINATPDGCVGIFSTSYSRGTYSVGSEMDGMWGFYRVYRQDYGGLEQYVIVGKTLKEVVTAYAGLAGYPLLVPRWAFGYLSGGFKYAMLDDPPASQALFEVARKLKENDIPCSAHQLSSGYSFAVEPPQIRNVFTWNSHRFPDPEGFLKQYRQLGIRVIANIKPYLLEHHPDYQKLKDSGALFTDPTTKQSAVTRLWSAGGGESADGGHIDFTSTSGFQWWYEGVRMLYQQGVACMWNDNNEYTVTDDNWECALDQPSLTVSDGNRAKPQIGRWGRYLHTELHCKASHDAMADHLPDQRPFVLTRSATAGAMRYAASTWSGDNSTSWPGMKGANALSLNAGMCLMHCYGHDIGGFEGPQPSPELLLRWVQLGCHSPRFAINCFKTGTDNKVGDVIEPWMYPSITHLVRKAIKRRYAMIPYIYSLALEGHLTAEPPQRWTGWGYEADAEVWTPEVRSGETQYWLGESLLVGGVYEPGVKTGRVYLPKKERDGREWFVNLNPPYEQFGAGQWVTVDAAWHGAGIPLLAKVGTAIPIGRDVQVLSPGETENPAELPQDDYRALEIFPPQGVSDERWFTYSWHEDDGISSVKKNKISGYTIKYQAAEEEIHVEFERYESSGFAAPWKTLEIILPVGDERRVVASGKEVRSKGKDETGRGRYELL